MEQLSVAEEKLAAVMTRLLGVDIFNKKLEMDEERFVPEGLGYKTDLFEEEEKVGWDIFLLFSKLAVCRRRKMWRVDLRRKRSLPEDISRDSQTSFSMPKAEASVVEENAKLSLFEQRNLISNQLTFLFTFKRGFYLFINETIVL